MRVTKRQLGKYSLASILGATGLALVPENNTAVEMNKLQVPNKDIQTANPVSGIRLNLEGDYSWDTSVTPTRAILRVNVTRAGETTQLDAKALSGQFSPSQQGTYEFKKVNSLKHPEINAPSLSPTEVGESKSIEFTISVVLEVLRDGSKLGETKAEDTVQITVEKRQAKLEASVSGEGSITVHTSTPNA